MGFLIMAVILIPIILAVVNVMRQRRECLDARDTVEAQLKERGFTIEKQVGVTAKLYVDNTQKLWAINEWNGNTDVQIYRYSDLIDFELLEDDESLVKGGFGKALVGGAIGGTTGAIIGSAGSRRVKQNVTLLEVKIRTNDFQHPQYSVQFIKGTALPKSSPAYTRLYDEAQEVIGVLNYIAKNGDDTQPFQKPAAEFSDSTATKLRELHQLKTDGIITDDEFEAKKRELLNMP